MATELWQFPFSHYNEKVRWALDHKAWPHRRQSLAPGFHIPTALRVSGQPVTPILCDDGRTITDSTDIIAYLEQRRPEPPLYPEAPELRTRALALEDWFDEHVGDDMRRLFYHAYAPHPADCARMSTVDTNPLQSRAFRALMPVMRGVLHLKMKLGQAHVERAERGMPTYFDKVARELGPSGYLVGDCFTVADLTAAALLSLVVLPEQFPYALPGNVPPRLSELRASVENHEGFRWVLDIYAKHRPPETTVLTAD